MPQISVIVPVYKVEKYLNKCIDSILAQSFQDFDLVLVDDGSPDNCPQICDAYAQMDSRTSVIHKKNGGLSDARNAGIDWSMAHSASDYLVFVDSDDFLNPDYLLRLYDTAKLQSSDLAICDFVRVDENDTIFESETALPEIVTEDKKEFWLSA